MEFKSKPKRATQKRFEEYIWTAKSANPFGDVSWNAPVWVVPRKLRESKGRDEERIWFGSKFVAKSTLATVVPFSEPFNDFVKANVCHMEERAKKGLPTNDHNIRVRAFRYLYASMPDGEKHPSDLVPANFNSASRHCLDREAQSTAYQIGKKLASIADCLDQERMCLVRLQWKNPAPRSESTGGAAQMRIGQEFVDRRAKKLPGRKIFEALGALANAGDLDEQDLIRQRALEIEVCTGLRLNELLMLPVNCWVTESQLNTDGTQVTGKDGSPIQHFGIRCTAEKMKEARTKWLPTLAVDIVRRAIADITRVTQPFRDVAAFMHANPGRTLLPTGEHHCPDPGVIGSTDVARLVGMTGQRLDNNGRQFIQGAGLPVQQGLTPNGRPSVRVRQLDLENYLMSRSSPSVVFPGGESDQRLKDCLFVVGANYFHRNKATLNGTAVVMTETQLSDYLVSRGRGGARSVDGSRSIFERRGYSDEGGKPLRVTTSQFRHWLDTVAVEGGLSDVEIAHWFYRKDPRQNAAYNHMTPMAYARSIRDAMIRGDAVGPFAEATMNIRDPVRRSEFVTNGVVAVHETDLGGCVHNWAAPQCPEHRECAVCDEHGIRKGDSLQMQNTQVPHDRTVHQIRIAERKVEENAFGANNWLAHQVLVRERTEQMLAIHNDESIPDGTWVQLATIPRPKV